MDNDPMGGLQISCFNFLLIKIIGTNNHSQRQNRDDRIIKNLGSEFAIIILLYKNIATNM